MSALKLPARRDVRQPLTANPQRDVTVAELLPAINERYEHTLRRLGR